MAAHMAPRTSSAVEEAVTISVSTLAGEFGIDFGGECAGDPHGEGWLSIGLYRPHDGSLNEGQLIPCELDAGRASFGLVTPTRLRQLADALRAAADRYDTIAAHVISGAPERLTPPQSRQRRARPQEMLTTA